MRTPMPMNHQLGGCFDALRKTRATNPDSIRCQSLRSYDMVYHATSTPMHLSTCVCNGSSHLRLPNNRCPRLSRRLPGSPGRCDMPSRVLRHRAPRHFMAATHILLSGCASSRARCPASAKGWLALRAMGGKLGFAPEIPPALPCAS